MINFNIINLAYEKFPLETMPFITESIEQLKYKRPYSGLKIVHNLHITFSTICKIIPLLYSGADLTMTVTDELQSDPNALKLLKNANVKFIKPENLPNDFDISLDCGGELTKFITPRIGAAELTQSGKIKYQNASVNYPVISVDESNLKKLETLLGTGDGFIRALSEFTKDDIKNKKIILFGYGKVGHGIVRSLQPFTKNIIVIECKHKQIQKAIQDGYQALSFFNAEKVLPELNNVFCVVTATGVKAAVSQAFNQTDFNNCMYLANMGTEDEFGNNFCESRVLCNKAPINFSLNIPTLSKYLDPVLYAHNSIIDLLLSGKFSNGFHGLPFDFDMKILTKWKKIYGKNCARELSAIFGENIKHHVSKSDNLSTFFGKTQNDTLYQYC